MFISIYCGRQHNCLSVNARCRHIRALPRIILRAVGKLWQHHNRQGTHKQQPTKAKPHFIVIFKFCRHYTIECSENETQINTSKEENKPKVSPAVFASGFRLNTRVYICIYKHLYWHT